jgi:hypothetical protein
MQPDYQKDQCLHVGIFDFTEILLMSISLLDIVLLYFPLIISGTLNMMFVKSRRLESLHVPIDAGYTFANGKRLFGDNKTWKGLLGMSILTSLSTWLFSQFAVFENVIIQLNFFDYCLINRNGAWLFWGFIIGFSYGLFELPNSSIKRQLDIGPGQNVSGIKGFIFTVADQLDSIIGVVIVFSIMFSMSLSEALIFSSVGVILHFIVNVFLFGFGLKRQWR